MDGIETMECPTPRRNKRYRDPLDAKARLATFAVWYFGVLLVLLLATPVVLIILSMYGVISWR